MRYALIGTFVALLTMAGCKTGTSDSGTTGASSSQAGTAPNGKPTTVVMAINLGEEDEQGGCGDVIHAVRAAAAKGVRTREIDTRKKGLEAASKKYRIMVQPTVVLVDDADREIRRYEGESTATITALKADLDQMAKR